MAESSTNPTARKPPLHWQLSLAGVLWLVMIMPPVTLISWLIGQPALNLVLCSLILAPLLFLWAWRAVTRATVRARWLTMQYMGICAVLLPLLIPAGLATFFASTPIVGVATLAVWVVLCGVGLHASTRVVDKRLSIISTKLDKPYRLVQISDVHVGSRSTRFLNTVVDQVLSHSPDVTVITGDLLDLDNIGFMELEPLTRLSCPVYLCLGNHECYVDLDIAIASIESCDIQVLRNRSLKFDGLQIHGVDDQNDPKRVAAILDTLTLHNHQFQILLYHRPDGWSSALQRGIDLTLSGHTHAGQIWPFGLLVKRQFQHLVGHFEHLGQHLYVSPGTGTWGPIMRLGTRCEMTVIDLGPES